MRKLLFASVVLILFAAPSFAVFHLGITGGYSYSSLAELTDYWEQIKADSETNSLAANWKGYGNGVFANGDFNFNLNPNFLIGVRSGIQYIFPSTYTGFIHITDPFDEWISTETSNYDFLVPIMGGFCFYLPLGDAAMGLRLEAYGGWGLAYCAQDTKYDGSSVPMLSLYSGGGFMADVSGAIEFKILPFFTVSINGGYRFAKMTDFKSIKSISVTTSYGDISIPANDPFNDASGNPIAVDFTGINIGVGINIRI